MSKDDFTREWVRDKFLKTVIIRIDYTGVRDVKDLVKSFDKRFPSVFHSSRDFYNTKFSLTLRPEDLKDISESTKVPINTIEKVKISRYQKMKGVAADVILDISQYFMCMEIKCMGNYEGLDKYVECFKGAITVFEKDIPYFQVKRFGLRKRRVEDRELIENFDDVFEDFVFNLPPYGSEPTLKLKSEYVDYIEFSSNEFKGYKSNIRRNVGRYKKYPSDKSVDVYVTTLDVDVYCKGDKLSKISNLLYKANQLEFKIYKSCMKEEYLSTIYEKR